MKSILYCFVIKDCNPYGIPLDVNSDQNTFKREIYKAVIGCIKYAVTAIWLDLSSAVNILSQYISNSRVKHWQYVKLILQYLKDTFDYSLFFDGLCNEVRLVLRLMWIMQLILILTSPHLNMPFFWKCVILVGTGSIINAKHPFLRWKKSTKGLWQVSQKSTVEYNNSQ